MRSRLKTIWRIVTFPLKILFWPIRMLARWLHYIVTSMKVFFADEPEDTPLPDAFANVVRDPVGILEHLNELRKHLFRALVAMVITSALAFTFIKPILEMLSTPLAGGLGALVAIDVTENVGTVMRVALLFGFAFAFPYIAFELWMFMAPGLKRRSRLVSLLAIPVATIFFLAGMAFAYFVMLPVGLPFLLNFLGMKTEARPSSYFSFVLSLMFWIGLAFEFPIVTTVMAKIGVLRAETLSKQWRIAMVVIAVVAAMATPTVDPINMALVMAPMSLLYLLSIILARFAQPKLETLPPAPPPKPKPTKRTGS